MNTQTVLLNMIEYNAGDPMRAQHLIKVHSFANLICELEHVDLQLREIISVAALVHDIGIRNSERKYDNSAGHYQELEGPPEAETLLLRLGYAAPFVERVCWLVGHHHTYGSIQELDHQILVEADFLVNAYEGEMDPSAIATVREKIFRTNGGIRLLDTLYPPCGE
jgi:hypothetical protein